MGSTAVLLLLALLQLHACYVYADGRTAKFEDVVTVIEQKRLELSGHAFFSFLRDESIPETKRMSFIPYWTYYALSFADILDSWVRIPEPKNELEHRINVFVNEDNFHYNLFLHDLEEVLDYSLKKFGSYTAVARHIWGDDSKSIRQLMYSWISLAKKYEDDPLVVLSTFEVMEAGLKDIFESTYASIYKVNQKGGLKELKYWGQTHLELEVNRTVTSWFKEGEQLFRPLVDYEITEQTKARALEVVEELFERYRVMYDSLYNLVVAEDSISPEKYHIEGYPAIIDFPAIHPNRPTAQWRDEL